MTGPTAINIDVSDRLAGALLPFAAIVIGLSLLLLMIVFRSIAVPVKATFGYLLSVGAALGAVVVVFQWGWLDGALPGLADGPIVSFLPIFVMGVLFGLAMDYEMFLVSAMREEFVRTGDARDAVLQRLPGVLDGRHRRRADHGQRLRRLHPRRLEHHQADRPWAGGRRLRRRLPRADDAVPAVLVLLGRWAWWLPGWLDRQLPAVDVEGAAMHRRWRYEHWEAEHGPALVRATWSRRRGGATDLLEITARAGEVTRVGPGRRGHRPGGARAGAGRTAASGAGELVVAGLLLPEQASAVQRRAVLVQVGRSPGRDETALTVPELVARRARLSHVTRRGRRDFRASATELLGRLQGRFDRELEETAGPAAGGAGTPGGGKTTEQRRVDRTALLDAVLAVIGGARVVVLCSTDTSDVERARTVTALARALADEHPRDDDRTSLGVLVVDGGDTVPGPEPASPAALGDREPVVAS